MTARPPMDLADYVRELTETHSHAEHYQVRRGRTWYGANHVTQVPPLLVPRATQPLDRIAAIARGCALSGNSVRCALSGR